MELFSLPIMGGKLLKSIPIPPPQKKKTKTFFSASESTHCSQRPCRDHRLTTFFCRRRFTAGFWPIHQIVYVHLWGAVLVLRGFTNRSNFLGRKGAVLFFLGVECENRQIWGGLRKMRSNQKQRYVESLDGILYKNCIFCCVCVIFVGAVMTKKSR